MTSTWGHLYAHSAQIEGLQTAVRDEKPYVANVLAAEVRSKTAGQDEFLNEQFSDLSNKCDEHQSTMHDNISEVCKGVDASFAGLWSKNRRTGPTLLETQPTGRGL